MGSVCLYVHPGMCVCTCVNIYTSISADGEATVNAIYIHIEQ